MWIVSVLGCRRRPSYSIVIRGCDWLRELSDRCRRGLELCVGWTRIHFDERIRVVEWAHPQPFSYLGIVDQHWANHSDFCRNKYRTQLIIISNRIRLKMHDLYRDLTILMDIPYISSDHQPRNVPQDTSNGRTGIEVRSSHMIHRRHKARWSTRSLEQIGLIWIDKRCRVPETKTRKRKKYARVNEFL